LPKAKNSKNKLKILLKVKGNFLESHRDNPNAIKKELDK